MTLRSHRRHSTRHRGRPRLRLQLEQLENRRLLSIIPVLPGVESLRSAIGTAEHNADAENTLTLSAGSYSLDSNLGKLLIENASALSHKTLTITGAGPSDTTIVPGDAATWRDRILQIVGSDVSVIFQHLTIAGGVAMDGGGVGGFTAVGGGLLIVGAQVTLSDVHVFNNTAVGSDGDAGDDGTQFNLDGGDGDDGKEANGGGIYLASGSLTIKDGSVIDANFAQGGAGGDGGNGTIDSKVPDLGTNGAIGFPGTDGGDNLSEVGDGGNGGKAGEGKGGGIYVADGLLVVQNSTISNNRAFGGDGGEGGAPGETYTSVRLTRWAHRCQSWVVDSEGAAETDRTRA